MKTVLYFLAALAFCSAVITGIGLASADASDDASPQTSAIAQADTGAVKLVPAPDAGSSAAAPATATAPTTIDPTPTVEDVSLTTKLWKSGAFFAAGIMSLYLGLFVWGKLDKKRAFYASTALAGVAILVASIRAGDTPTTGQIVSTLASTLGILINGPAKA